MNENYTYRLVIAELKAMQDVGMSVPEKAYDLAYSETLSTYSAVSIAELADLLIQLAGVPT